MKNKSVLLVFLLSFFTSFAHAKTCNVSENTLKWAWLGANSHAPFEQMEFSIEGKQKVFNSWLHERPEVMGGSWSLKRCRLSISLLIFGFARPNDGDI